MYLVITTLRDENIERVLADPPQIWSVLKPDRPELVERERSKGHGLFARLFGRKPPPRYPTPLYLADGDALQCDLDKAWHGIHFMLTGTNWKGEFPLNFLVLGGTQVGKVEAGYGPARAFRSDQVRAICAALEPIDEAFLRPRYDPDEMIRAGIYPAIWDRDPAEDDAFGYCAAYFLKLKEFVAEASRRGVGLVVTVT